jgi:hypothetical protein
MVRAVVINDNTGIKTEIPVLLIDRRGCLKPLLDYILEHSQARSYSWMRKVIQALELLIDYMLANHNTCKDPQELFKTFAQRLYTGTINENGDDPSGLFWLPRKAKMVKQIIYHISRFSDWLSKHTDTEPLNPWRDANRYEEMLNWAAYYQKQRRAFLGHIWLKENASTAAKRTRNVVLRRTPKFGHGDIKRFPDNRFLDLLFEGFVVPGKKTSPRYVERLNLRDILITLLQHCGGLRMCEPFHLWVQDVMPDPFDSDVAMVRIFHPSQGMAPPDWFDAYGKPIECIRVAYLHGKYQMRPRTAYLKSSMHAGWKDPELQSSAGFIFVYWYPRWAGKLFKLLWDTYLFTQRSMLNCHHPFAFTNKKGNLYAIRDYVDAHALAVRRIGLVPAKMNGTTPHGHRHAYAQRLIENDINSIIIKKALHHKSLESQIVYSEPTIDRVTQILSASSDAIANGMSINPISFLKYGFEDIDSASLFFGSYPKLKRKYNG